MTITAAVDGSALGNPGPAGWAWVVSETCWDAGGWAHGTNNLGELTAVLELLRATRTAGFAEEPLHVLADSQYAINVVTKWSRSWKKKGWVKADKKPIANLEVIRAIDSEIAGRPVTFEWVRGHAGHAMNEMADDRARGAAEAFQAGSPVPSGPGFAPTGAHEGGADHATGDTTPGDTPPGASTRGGSPTDGGTEDPGRHALVEGASRVNAPEAAERVVVDAEKRFIRAWAAGDGATLTRIAAPGAVRVWPDGSRTDGLGGPVPAGLRVSRLVVRAVGSGAWFVTYALTWEDGSSLEASLWEPTGAGAQIGAEDLGLVWHQSTPRTPTP